LQGGQADECTHQYQTEESVKCFHFLYQFLGYDKDSEKKHICQEYKVLGNNQRAEGKRQKAEGK